MKAFDKAVLRAKYGYNRIGEVVRVIEIDGMRARVIRNDAMNADDAFDVNVAELCPANHADEPVLSVIGILEVVAGLGGSLTYNPSHTHGLYVSYRDIVRKTMERARLPSEARSAVEYAFDAVEALAFRCQNRLASCQQVEGNPEAEARAEIERASRTVWYAMFGEPKKEQEGEDGQQGEAIGE